MIDIPMRTSQPLDCNSILNINIPTQTNQIFAQAAVNQTTVKTSESNRQTPSSAAINRSPAHSQASNQQTSPQTTVSQAPVPTQASIREIAIPIITKKNTKRAEDRSGSFQASP